MDNNPLFKIERSFQVNIKWSYYLIAGIYALLITLRSINYFNEITYKKENSHYRKAFSIKKDFFTTVALICILVTLAINMAALIGGKTFNTDSMIITLLVIGFTVINSFTFILFSEESSTICLLGYTLKAGDIEKVKIREGKNKDVLNITFNREIESYNYAKLLVYGKNKKSLTTLFSKLETKKEEK